MQSLSSSLGGGASLSFPALESRGYKVRSFLKQSLYGCVVLASAPAAGALVRQSSRPSSRPLGSPTMGCVNSSTLPATHPPTVLRSMSEASGISACALPGVPSAPLSFAPSSPLVCVKISRMWLATHHASPDAHGHLSAVRDRVLSEASILRRLASCAGVAHVIDEFTDDEHHFLVTRFAGKELFDVVSSGVGGVKPTPGGGLPVPFVHSYASQLAHALAHLHASGVAHLDLSLTNVCVDEEHHVRIIDFGVADTGEEAGIVKREHASTNLLHVPIPSALQAQLIAAATASSLASPSPQPSAAWLRSPFNSPLPPSSLVSSPGSALMLRSPPSSDRSSAMVLSSPPPPSTIVGNSGTHGGGGAGGGFMHMSSPLLHSSSHASLLQGGGMASTGPPSGESSGQSSPGTTNRISSLGFSQLHVSGLSSTNASFSSPASTYMSPPSSSAPARSRRGSMGMFVTPMQACPVAEEQLDGEPGGGGVSPMPFSLGASAVKEEKIHEIRSRTITVNVPTHSHQGSSVHLIHTPPSSACMGNTTAPMATANQAAFSWPAHPAQRSRTDMPPSKLHCQSPEQRRAAAAQSHHISGSAFEKDPQPSWCPFSSDVYAFAVIVYEMALGVRWQAKIVEAALAQQQQGAEDVKHEAPVAMDEDVPMVCSPTAFTVSPAAVPSKGAKDEAAISAARESLAQLDPQLVDLLRCCVAPEATRIQAAALIQHPFFAASVHALT